MSESALLSCAEAADLAATAEEEEELVSGSENETGVGSGCRQHVPNQAAHGSALSAVVVCRSGLRVDCQRTCWGRNLFCSLVLHARQHDGRACSCRNTAPVWLCLQTRTSP